MFNVDRMFSGTIPVTLCRDYIPLPRLKMQLDCLFTPEKNFDSI
jgi:hypothetical protein